MEQYSGMTPPPKKRPLPAIGVLAFIVLIISGVFSLVVWHWLPVAIGGGIFLALASFDAYQVGQGK